MTRATQVSRATKGGGFHAVGLGDLRVMVFTDGPEEWYAQGLEIDYIAQGSTLEEAQRAFERGLKETIAEHLQAVGDIAKLLVPAPTEVWEDFFKRLGSDCYYYSHVSFHKLGIPTQNIILHAATAPGGKKVRRAAARHHGAPAKAVPYEGVAFYAAAAM